jgi:hypothetical protein
MDIGNISNDAFKRLRVSTADTLFDSQSQYDVQPLLWNIKKTSGGSETHLPNESATRLAVTSSNNEYIIRQTKEYFHYEPGKSHLVLVSFAFGPTPPGISKKVGYFDDQNGIYLENSGGQLYIVKRSYVGGSVVNTSIPTGSWNNLKNVAISPAVNPEKAQIFWVDLQWLGVGSVRCGLVIDGQFCLMHTFSHSNIIDATYMRTATLPVRYEIVNSTASVASSMRAIACSVQSENGLERIYGFNACATNGATPVSVTTRRQVLGVRPAALFNSIANRAQYDFNQLCIRCATNDALIELVYNPASVTSASFAAVNGAYSAMELDVTGAALTGGTVLLAFPVAAGSVLQWSPVGEFSLMGKIPLSLDVDGSNPTVLSVVATAFTGTASVSATLNWTEYR